MRALTKPQTRVSKALISLKALMALGGAGVVGEEDFL
jgi:hypothetical protein